MPKTFNKEPWFDYPSSNWKQKHAVIIGGGIAGCQMAWHLCDKNWQVTLIERHNKLATEASGNPAGVISPKMTSKQSIGEDFYRACFEYTLSLLEKLDQQGLKTDWHNCGALQLTHNAREQKRWDALSQRDFDKNYLQLLDEDKTSQQAGIELSYKSSYFPQAGWIKPASFCQALIKHPNCNVIYQSEALELAQQDDVWQVLDKNKTTIAQAEAIIICSGKDLLTLKQCNFLPSMPVAGQTTSATATTDSKQLKTVLGHEGYLTPKMDNILNNQHIFGATFEREQNNPRLKSQADFENINQLARYLPAFSASLSQFKSAHTSVRLTTPDRFPYVGAVPDKDYYQKHYHDLHQGKKHQQYPQAKYQKGLFILGGLGSRGLTSSALCAKSLCDILENTTASPSQEQQLLHYCHPARFLIKSLKRNSKT